MQELKAGCDELRGETNAFTCELEQRTKNRRTEAKIDSDFGMFLLAIELVRVFFWVTVVFSLIEEPGTLFRMTIDHSRPYGFEDNNDYNNMSRLAHSSWHVSVIFKSCLR